MEKELFDFLEYQKRKGLKDNSIGDYRKAMSVFFNFLRENYPDVNEVTEITKDIILSYEKYLIVSNDARGKTMSLSRRKRYLACLRAFFLYLQKEERIYRNPAINMAFPRERKKLLKDVLTIEEMDKLLKLCSGHSLRSLRDRAIMELLYSTGIRADELCNVEVQDIDLVDMLLFVRKGKLGNQRLIPFGESAKYWLKRYIEKGRPLIGAPKEIAKAFVSGEARALVSSLSRAACGERSRTESRGEAETFDPGRLLFLSLHGSKLRPDRLCKISKKWAERAGITKNVTTHTFRHTCASHILKGGADIRYVQQQLGHRNISTTEKYLKIEITDLKAVHERCHPREQEDW